MESPFNYEQWGVEEWCQYLQQEGHGEWEDTFRENNIPGNRMLSLMDTDLEAMGITPSGDRLKILHSIRKLWQMKSKVLNDPIHGHVELHPLLIKIIDTPQFQRLRNIKQLGGAYFVYPGASHNRFEHSIGVGHLAGQLVQALSTVQPELGITERDILCVTIAGLCHDLGHGPFSHLFDQMFIAKMRPGRNWKHEEASVKMFEHLVESNNLEPMMTNHGLVLKKDLVFIKELIKGPPNSKAVGPPNSKAVGPPNSKAVGPPNSQAVGPPNSKAWPYEGRTEDKSFLYEIVANKTNGIDVDKFDYLARDCYHLGIKNNFDYDRFIKFARVCEVDGQKHICTRDKEVDNMYGMFDTRCYLHRRAYQHNVNKLIMAMITDAFVEADEHIQIEGSGGKMFKLSTAIDDMKAYTKLTDHVFEQILNSSSPELAKAREILDHVFEQILNSSSPELAKAREILDHVFEQILNSSSPELAKAREILGRIKTRDLYKFLDTWQTDQPIKVSEEIISRWKEGLAQAFPQNDAPGDTLTSEDFEVTVITVDYGMKGKDPIKNMYFYSKNDLTTAFRLPKEQESKIRPKCFSEQLINVYCKKTDDQSLKTAQEHFDQWYKDMGFPRRQDGDTVTPELPEENVQNK